MPDNTIAGFRLSAQQERVWTHQAGAPFRAHCSILLEGPLNSSKLQEALRALVHRHEILRTVFHRQPGLKLPFQVIQETGDVAWETVDLSGIGEPTQAKRIEDWFHAAAFNFEQGPVMHALLATHAPERRTLLLNLPALASDTRGLQNLVKELGHAYAAALQDEALTDDVMQYADVVQWQTELLESDDTKAGRDFWRDYCRQIDFPALAAWTLPDENKSESSVFTLGVFAVTLDAPTAATLSTVAVSSRANFLLACWSTLLHRLTGRNEIVIGDAFDGRKYEELESAVGLFARHLPLQLRFEPESTFKTFWPEPMRQLLRRFSGRKVLTGAWSRLLLIPPVRCCRSYSSTANCRRSRATAV